MARKHPNLTDGMETHTKPWHEEQPGRLELEREAIMKLYPTASFTFLDSGAVEVVVPVTVPMGRTGRVTNRQLRVAVPVDYPTKPPRAFAADLTFHRRTSRRYRQQRPPHLYDDDALCLYYPNDPDHLRWLPEDGIVTIIIWAEQWLASFYVWRFTNRWPGESAPH